MSTHRHLTYTWLLYSTLCLLFFTSCRSTSNSLFDREGSSIWGSRGVIGSFSDMFMSQDPSISNFSREGFEKDKQLLRFTALMDEYYRLVGYKDFQMVCLPKDCKVNLSKFKIPTDVAEYQRWLETKPVGDETANAFLERLRRWDAQEPIGLFNGNYTQWKTEKPQKSEFVKDLAPGSEAFTQATQAYEKTLKEWQEREPVNPKKKDYQEWENCLNLTRRDILDRPEDFSYCMRLTASPDTQAGFSVLDPITLFFKVLIEGVRDIFVDHQDPLFGDYDQVSFYVIFDDSRDIQLIAAWFQEMYQDRFDPRRFIFPPLTQDLNQARGQLRLMRDIQVDVSLETVRAHTFVHGISFGGTGEVESVVAVTKLNPDGSLPTPEDTGNVQKLSQNEIAIGVVNILFAARSVQDYLNKLRSKVKSSDEIKQKIDALLQIQNPEEQEAQLKILLQVIEACLDKLHEEQEIKELLAQVPYNLGSQVVGFIKKFIVKYTEKVIRHLLLKMREATGDDTRKVAAEHVKQGLEALLAFLSTNDELRRVLAIHLSQVLQDLNIFQDEVKRFRDQYVRYANHLFYNYKEGIRPPETRFTPSGISPSLDYSASVFDREVNRVAYRGGLGTGVAVSMAVYEVDDTQTAQRIISYIDSALAGTGAYQAEPEGVPVGQIAKGVVTGVDMIAKIVGRNDLENKFEDVRFVIPTDDVISVKRIVKGKEVMLPPFSCTLVAVRGRKPVKFITEEMYRKDFWSNMAAVKVTFTQSTSSTVILKAPIERILKSE